MPGASEPLVPAPGQHLVWLTDDRAQLAALEAEYADLPNVSLRGLTQFPPDPQELAPALTGLQLPGSWHGIFAPAQDLLGHLISWKAAAALQLLGSLECRPSRAEADLVVDWLKAQGFTCCGQSADQDPNRVHLWFYAPARAAQWQPAQDPALPDAATAVAQLRMMELDLEDLRESLRQVESERQALEAALRDVLRDKALDRGPQAEADDMAARRPKDLAVIRVPEREMRRLGGRHG